MTTEEKAKAYDEALERAQKATRAGSDVATDIVQYIFPVLAESEDERIRKEIYKYIKDTMVGGTLRTECLAWLEKQKEQKPTEWIYPYGKNETVDKLIAIAECLEMDDCSFNGYTGEECGQFLRELARKQIEYKPAEWSEEDKKMLNNAIHACLDIYGTMSETADWLKTRLESLRPQPKQERSEKDKETLPQFCWDLGEMSYKSAKWSEEEAKKAAEDYADKYPGMTHENDGSTIEDYDTPYNAFMAGVLWASHQLIAEDREVAAENNALKWL